MALSALYFVLCALGALVVRNLVSSRVGRDTNDETGLELRDATRTTRTGRIPECPHPGPLPSEAVRSGRAGVKERDGARTVGRDAKCGTGHLRGRRGAPPPPPSPPRPGGDGTRARSDCSDDVAGPQFEITIDQRKRQLRWLDVEDLHRRCRRSRRCRGDTQTPTRRPLSKAAPTRDLVSPQKF